MTGSVPSWFQKQARKLARWWREEILPWVFFDRRGWFGACADRMRALEVSVGSLAASLAELERRLGEAERAATRFSPPAGPPVSKPLLLTERAQVLKLASDGNTTHQIAAALGVAQGEVSLLLKLQEIHKRPAAHLGPRIPAIVRDTEGRV